MFSIRLGKLLILIMNARLNDFLEKNKIINKCQIGFRRKHRTADHLLLLKSIIDKIDCYKLKLNINEKKSKTLLEHYDIE